MGQDERFISTSQDIGLESHLNKIENLIAHNADTLFDLGAAKVSKDQSDIIESFDTVCQALEKETHPLQQS